MIGNILNNAAKFTPPHGSVSLVLERNGSEALIRIRDTGIGIEEGQLSRVFELFMQANVSPERRGGLSIGLTLAKSLVERHDGRITVHSVGPGTGSEFVIHLPARTDALEGLARSSDPSAVEIRAAPRRVLVVDDNRDAAELVALSLGFDGHDVRQAYDGLEALETAATFHPHVVLLDIGLPRLNGYEVAQRIGKRPGLRPILIALTGWGEGEDRRRSSAAGFDVHLVKPIDHEVLAMLIADLAPTDPS